MFNDFQVNDVKAIGPFGAVETTGRGARICAR